MRHAWQHLQTCLTAALCVVMISAPVAAFPFGGRHRWRGCSKNEAICVTSSLVTCSNCCPQIVTCCPVEFVQPPICCEQISNSQTQGTLGGMNGIQSVDITKLPDPDIQPTNLTSDLADPPSVDELMNALMGSSPSFRGPKLDDKQGQMGTTRMNFAGLQTIRTWRDNTGNYSVEAEMTGGSSTHVQLRKASGKTISVAFSRLSAKDRDFVLNSQRQSARQVSKMSTLTVSINP